MPGPAREPPASPVRHLRRPRERAPAQPTTKVTDEFVRELHAMLTTLVRRAPLFNDLAGRGLTDDLVQDALLAVTQRIEAGHPIDEPFSYARRCAENLAKRAYLRAAREAAVGAPAIERLAPVVEDVAEHAQQRAAIGEVLEMIRSVNAVIVDLDPLALELVRAELARTDQKQLAARLGISRPTLYRRKGPAIQAFVTAVAARAGTVPCPQFTGALLAAAGDSGFEGARSASIHAAGCAGCRETIRHLAVARHGLAIITPIPLMAGATTDPTRGLERLHAAADTAADWARNLIVRVGDPTPVGGSAAKTAALVAAACTGGGGIYCAVDGIPATLKAPFAHSAPASRRAVVRASTPAAGPQGRAVPVVLRVPAEAAVAAAQTATAQDVARRRARAKRARESAAARRRRAATVAAQEFAARHAPTKTRATQEFAAPPVVSAGTIARQEFAQPASGPAPAVAAPVAGPGSPAQQEFGAP